MKERITYMNMQRCSNTPASCGFNSSRKKKDGKVEDRERERARARTRAREREGGREGEREREIEREKITHMQI